MLLHSPLTCVHLSTDPQNIPRMWYNRRWHKRGLGAKRKEIFLTGKDLPFYEPWLCQTLEEEWCYLEKCHYSHQKWVEKCATSFWSHFLQWKLTSIQACTCADKSQETNARYRRKLCIKWKFVRKEKFMVMFCVGIDCAVFMGDKVTTTQLQHPVSLQKKVRII
jgi:hypothetical protein